MNLLDDLSEKEGVLKKAKVASSFLKNAPQFIDKEKAPEGINITNLIVNMITRGSYDAIGEFNLKSLFIGSMWFQDAWNLGFKQAAEMRNTIIRLLKVWCLSVLITD